MRNKKRVPLILAFFKKNNEALIDFVGYDLKLTEKNWEYIKNLWLKYPDLRFGQLLCNSRFIDNLTTEDKIWNIEEVDWLIKNHYFNIEDIAFWGVNYYKNGNLRKKTKHVLLKDLTTDHIKAIIKFFINEDKLYVLNSQYLEYFNKRIELNEQK